jgi:hypothetical protein
MTTQGVRGLAGSPGAVGPSSVSSSGTWETRHVPRATCTAQDYAATAPKGYSISGKRGEELKDQIAQEIVSELRLIREELQNLTMAVRSASTSRNSENSYTGKSHKFYPRRATNPTDVRHPQGHKPPPSPQRGEPRSQWHQNAPKDTR